MALLKDRAIFCFGWYKPKFFKMNLSHPPLTLRGSCTLGDGMFLQTDTIFLKLRFSQTNPPDGNPSHQTGFLDQFVLIPPGVAHVAV